MLMLLNCSSSCARFLKTFAQAKQSNKSTKRPTRPTIQPSSNNSSSKQQQQQHSSCQLPECCCCCTLSLSCVEFHYKMNMSFRCFCTQTHRRTIQQTIRNDTKQNETNERPRQAQAAATTSTAAAATSQPASNQQPTATSNLPPQAPRRLLYKLKIYKKKQQQ